MLSWEKKGFKEKMGCFQKLKCPLEEVFHLKKCPAICRRQIPLDTMVSLYNKNCEKNWEIFIPMVCIYLC